MITTNDESASPRRRSFLFHRRRFPLTDHRFRMASGFARQVCVKDCRKVLALLYVLDVSNAFVESTYLDIEKN